MLYDGHGLLRGLTTAVQGVYPILPNSKKARVIPSISEIKANMKGVLIGDE